MIALQGGVCVSNLFKMNFLSSPYVCTKLVDHIHHAGDFSIFSSFSLEKQNEATVSLLQKGVIFAIEAIQNSSAVALLLSSSIS